MLVFQTSTFWAGLGLLFSGTRRWWTGLVVLTIGLFPVVWVGIGTIQKDTLMAGMLLLVAGLLVVSRRTGKPVWAWLALIPCFIAITTRHNAAAAVPPLLIWWAIEVFPRASRWVIVTIAAVTTILLYGSASFVNERLTTEFIYPSQALLLHDVVAISLEEEQVILPEYARFYPSDLGWRPFTLDDLRTMYSVDYAAKILTPIPPQIRSISYIDMPEYYAMLTTTWRDAVTRYPVAYLVHRTRVMLATIGLRSDAVCVPYSFEFSPYQSDIVNVTYTPNGAFQALMPVWILFQSSWFFRAFLYLIVAAGMFVWAWRGRTPPQVPIMALTASALLYIAPLFFISITCDFRMNYWSVVATLGAVGLAVVYREKKVESLP